MGQAPRRDAGPGAESDGAETTRRRTTSATATATAGRHRAEGQDDAPTRYPAAVGLNIRRPRPAGNHVSDVMCLLETWASGRSVLLRAARTTTQRPHGDICDDITTLEGATPLNPRPSHRQATSYE
jgi:hypothetical protein